MKALWTFLSITEFTEKYFSGLIFFLPPIFDAQMQIADE